MKDHDTRGCLALTNARRQASRDYLQAARRGRATLSSASSNRSDGVRVRWDAKFEGIESRASRSFGRTEQLWVLL